MVTKMHGGGGIGGGEGGGGEYDSDNKEQN